MHLCIRPVQWLRIATFVVFGTLCTGLDLFWFTKPETNILPSNRSNEFAYCGRPVGKRYAGMRIVNGKVALKQEYPWIAKLLVDFMTVGAGSLITDRHILTAAHCLIFYNESSPLLPHCPNYGPNKNYEALPVSFFSFVLGSHLTANLPKDKVLQTISYVIHPDFDIFRSGQDIIQVNDIAIVRIQPVKFTSNILPICLPLPSEAIPDWMNLTVAGWGTISDVSEMATQPKSSRSPVLLKTSMTHLPYDYCKTYTKLAPYLAQWNCISGTEVELFCMYADNTDSCRGDSGGPVMSQQFRNFHTVAGIVSWGIGCNKPNTPSAYTNVRNYFHWILKNTKDGFYLPRPPPDPLNETFSVATA